MKKVQVEVGGEYRIRVSGRMCTVRIDEVNPSGGWYGTNLDTGRKIQVRSARRLNPRYKSPTGWSSI